MTLTMKRGARIVYRESPLIDPHLPLVTVETVADRIVGSHFRKDGKPKTGYKSEAVAKAEAARLGMTYYRCDFCDRFHLASKTQSGK
jgi:hypothetical protein